jgi:hypothetical protein
MVRYEMSRAEYPVSYFDIYLPARQQAMYVELSYGRPFGDIRASTKGPEY